MKPTTKQKNFNSYSKPQDKSHPCYQCNNRKELCYKSCIKLLTYNMFNPKAKEEKTKQEQIREYKCKYMQLNTLTIGKQYTAKDRYKEKKSKQITKPPKERKKLYTSRGDS